MSKKSKSKKSKSKKSKRTTKRLRKNITFNKKKSKTPTSLSVFPDQSPQLQKKGETTRLNRFTSKNVAIRDSKGKEYNSIVNDRLAYRRAPRGQNVQDFSEIMYGPQVVRLTDKNYKNLKKGASLYYDRGSSWIRGPFTLDNVLRGPELLMRVKDTAYNKYYMFTLAVNKLQTEKLYMLAPRGKTKRRRRKGGSCKKHRKPKTRPRRRRKRGGKRTRK